MQHTESNLKLWMKMVNITRKQAVSDFKLFTQMGLSPDQDFQIRRGCIDMHLHTLYGNGKYTPTEIVKFSRFLGLEVIGITDNNSVEGLDEAMEAGKIYGQKVIPGVEITTNYLNSPIRLLGYGQKLLTSQFKKQLKELTSNKMITPFEVIEFISKYNGINVIVCADIQHLEIHLIEKLLLKGIHGLEVIHPELDRTKQQLFKKISRKYNLFMLGGSDCPELFNREFFKLKSFEVPYSYYGKAFLGIKQISIFEGVDDISELSLEEKVGLIIKPGFEWPLLDEEDNRLIEGYGVGLNKINKDRVKNLEDLKSKIQKIIDISSIPALLTINQEGGRLNTIDFPNITLFPGNMSIGATRNEHLAYLFGGALGKQLYDLGITWNFAPVCDVIQSADNPSLGARCFGEKSFEVALLSSAFIRGMQEQGVAATAKHFPGLGYSTIDSHEEIPIINSISINDLLPFISAIKSKVASIMVANMKIIDLDSEYPAVLSKKIITDLLRKELKFEGVIVTENLSIPALIKEFGDIGEVAVRAFEAGADIVMIDPDFSKEKENVHCMQVGNNSSVKRKIEVYEALLQSICTGRISEERLNESVKRIWNMRTKYGIKKDTVRGEDWIIKEKENLFLAQKIADCSLTVKKQSKESKESLINDQNKIVILNFIPSKLTRADSSWKNTGNVFKVFQKYYTHVRHFEIKLWDSEETTPTIQVQPEEFVIISTYNLFLSSQREINLFKDIVNKLISQGNNLVHVALANPQDAFLEIEDLFSVFVYSTQEVSIESLYKFLSGKLIPKGQLPFSNLS